MAKVITYTKDGETKTVSSGKEVPIGGTIISDSTGNLANKVSSLVSDQSNIFQDTSSARKKETETATKLDNITGGGTTTTNVNTDTSGGATAKLVSEKIKDDKGNEYTTSSSGSNIYKLPTLNEGEKWVYDKSGKPMVMDATGNITENDIANQEYNANLERTTQIKKQNEIYDQMKENLDATHQTLIDKIKLNAEQSKIKMEDLNKRMLGSKTIAGFRTGSTEYTPEIAMGILKKEEEEGIQRVTDIDNEMNLAIAEAISAKNDDDLQLAQTKLDTYSKLLKEKETAVQDIYKAYIDNQKYIMDATKALETEERAKTDQAIQELKVKAPQLAKDYASATNKEAYLSSLIKSTGLDRETILGAIITATPKAKSGGSGKLTATEIKSNAISEMSTGFDSKVGADGYVDPNLWISARKAWVNNGLQDSDFLKNFKQYLNPTSYNLIPEFKKKTTSTRGS